MNGACVANDTCNCAEGYIGSVCEIECECFQLNLSTNNYFSLNYYSVVAM